MRDFFWTSQTAHRLPLIQFGPHLFFLMLMIFFQVSLYERRVYGAWANAIDSKFSGIVHRKLASHRDHGPFSGAIREPFLDTDQSGHGTDIDDRPVGFDQQRHGAARDQERP